MIRRTFLKALCASPLGFLIPKTKRTSTEICNEALKRLGKPGEQGAGTDKFDQAMGRVRNPLPDMQFYSRRLGVLFQAPTYKHPNFLKDTTVYVYNETDSWIEHGDIVAHTEI